MIRNAFWISLLILLIGSLGLSSATNTITNDNTTTNYVNPHIGKTVYNNYMTTTTIKGHTKSWSSSSNKEKIIKIKGKWIYTRVTFKQHYIKYYKHKKILDKFYVYVYFNHYTRNDFKQLAI